jgi:hypothetical protein
MAINESRSWAEVGAISTGPDTHVRDAFKGGHADKVLLPAGTILYKFNEYNSLVGASEADAVRDGPLSAAGAAFYASTLSPWWSPYESYKHDGGWVQRKKLAEHLGVSVREFGRVTSAIKENWNSVKYLLVITLANSAYAFFGGFAQMARIDAGAASRRVTQAPAGNGAFKAEGRGSTRNLPGGGTQFYIPNLRPGNVSTWRVESLLGS